MGSAKSQSPECGDVTAFNLAWWYSDVVEVIRAARFLVMSGLSQADCLWASDSSRAPDSDSADHCPKPKARGRSSGTLQRYRMEACSDAVPAAEAKKAPRHNNNNNNIIIIIIIIVVVVVVVVVVVAVVIESNAFYDIK